MKTDGGGRSLVLLKQNQEPVYVASSSKTTETNIPDTLLKIDYQYGIGAYAKGYPIPALVAGISIIRVADDRTLMKEVLTDQACDGKDYTLADYAKDNGDLYKKCFREMAEQFGHRIVFRYLR